MNTNDMIDFINENPEIKKMIEVKMQEKQEDELTMKIAAKSAEIEELQSKIKLLEADIDNLTMIRDGLHKQFTKKNATETTKHVSSKYIHLAYETLCELKQLDPCTNEFKRFDNLIRGRCKKATLFSDKWTKDDVIVFLLVNEYDSIISYIK